MKNLRHTSLFRTAALLCLMLAANAAAGQTDSCLITTLPYVQDFEGCVADYDDYTHTFSIHSSFVPCWRKMGDTLALPWQSIYITHSTHYGTNRLRWGDREGRGRGWQMLVLPKVDSSVCHANELALRFKFYNSWGMAPEMFIGIIGDPDDLTTLDTMALPLPSSSTCEMVVPLTPLSRTDGHIVLMTNTQRRLEIDFDDIAIERAGGCGFLYNITADFVGTTGALMRWNTLAPAGAAVRGTLTTPGAAAPVQTFVCDTSFCVLRQLTTNTSYTLWLTPLCGSGDTGSGSSFSFTTSNAPEGCGRPYAVVTRTGDDSVVIEWWAGNSDSSWNIYYQRPGDTTQTLADSGVTAMRYALTGLESGTCYRITVESDCGSHLSATVSALTTCQTLIDLPFVESFENMDLAYSCWHTRGAMLTADNKNLQLQKNGLVVLPEADWNIPSLAMGLKIIAVDGDFPMAIGVITDVSDTNTFTACDTIMVSSANGEFHYQEAYLDSYRGTGGRIAIKALWPRGIIYARIDTLTLFEAPWCRQPARVSIDSVTTSSAMLTWHPTPHSLSYEVEYGPSGFAHGDGMATGCFTDTLQLAGLRHSTRYDVYLRSHCGDGDTSEWSTALHFTTGCGAIDTLPYFEDFSHWGISNIPIYYTARPACWDFGRYNNRNDFYPGITAVEHDGITDTVLTLIDNGLLVSLPPLSSDIAIHSTQLSFKAWTRDDVGELPLVVGAGITAGSAATFLPLDTVLLNNRPTWFEIGLDDAAGAGNFAELMFNSSTSMTYIDSVSWDYFAGCRRPAHLRAAHIDSSHATLRWTERAGATQWQVEYGLRGFPLGSGTRITAGSDTVTIGGLTQQTRYDFYVRSICGTGDTSPWTLQPGRFTTTQAPARIPYRTSFEDTDDTLWQASSCDAINWFRGSAAGGSSGTMSFYISADSGNSVCPESQNVQINATMFRDIDFGNIDSTFTLTVKARHTRGTGTSSHNLLALIADPDEEVTSSWEHHTTPWGHRDSVVSIADMNTTQTWTEHSFEIDSLHGVWRLAFFWSNNYLSGQPAAIDDISIDYTPCPRPFNVHAVAMGAHSADLAWSGNSHGRYVVQLNSTNHPMTTDTVDTNSIHLVGLGLAEQYTATIYHLCDGLGTSNPSEPFTFTTRSCDDGTSDTIGDIRLTTTTDQLPIRLNSNYSYTQQLFRADELGGAGEITTIGLRMETRHISVSRSNCAIYMGHTDKDHFASNLDFADPAGMELVYMGRLQFKNGWTNIVLDSPFDYDGTSNLVVAIDDNSNAATDKGKFYCDDTDFYSAISCFSDLENPQPRTLAHLTGNNCIHKFYTNRSQISFDICQPELCSKPRLKAPNVRYSRATLRWHDDGAEEYQLEYKMTSASTWESQIVSDTSYTINDIIPTREYVYRIRRDCDSLGASGWTYGLFCAADMGCQPPEELQLDALNSHTAWLRWTPDGNNVSYIVRVFNSWFDTSLACYLANDTIGDLLPGITYYASVKASCDECDEMSGWSDTISFVMPTCPDAANLAYSDLQGNSVVLDWEADPGSTLWEIQYGLQGFDQGTGTSIYADHHPFTVSRLTGETAYDAYVRTVCGTDFFSEHWSNAVTFTTLYSGINDAAGDNVPFRITPNPATAHIYLTSSENSIYAAGTSISIRDALGKEVLSPRAPQSESQPIDIGTLSSGIYFVTVTTPSGSSTTKLIVQ